MESIFTIMKNMRRYQRRHGTASVFRRMKRELQNTRRWRRYAQGKLVEILGNRAYMDGLSYSLNSPDIATITKTRFLLGAYEKEERKFVKKYLLRNQPTIECGACIGGVACLTNTILIDATKHVVVEANPKLIPLLKANKEHNACQFSIIHAALAYEGSLARFYFGKRFVGGSIRWQDRGWIAVPAVILSDLLAQTGFDCINLILDIEGAEIDLIQNECDVLQKHVAMAIIEWHPRMFSTETEVKQAKKSLHNAGFTLLESTSKGAAEVAVYSNTRLV